MGVRDVNVDERAAINPSKIGYGVGDRYFFEDFEQAGGTDCTAAVPGLTVANIGVGAGTVYVTQAGGPYTNSRVVWDIGDGVNPSDSVDLFTTSLWSSQRNCTVKVRFPLGGDYTDILARQFGFVIGTTVANHSDDSVLVNLGADAVTTSGNIEVTTTIGGVATTFITDLQSDTGGSVLVCELTLAPGGKPTLRVNGSTVLLPETMAYGDARTFRGCVRLYATDPGALVARGTLDYIMVSEDRADA